MDVLENARNRLAEIVGMEFEASTAEEINERIKILASLIKELRTIKKELSYEMKLVRASYKESIAQVASKNHLVSGFLFGRSTPGKIRAENKR